MVSDPGPHDQALTLRLSTTQHEWLRDRAHNERSSIAELVRESIALLMEQRAQRDALLAQEAGQLPAEIPGQVRFKYGEVRC